MPFSHIVERARICRLSINFLSFPGFFERGALLKKSPLSHSFFFASSREINQAAPRAQSCKRFTRRRKDAKGKS
jgi:hypothetical protein